MAARCRHLLVGLMLTASALLGVLVRPEFAVAGTNWVVGRTGPNGGTGKADTLPAAPGGVDAQCASPVGATIDVTWTAVPHATGYTVYRSTTSSTSGFSSLVSVGGSTLSYSDTSLLAVATSYWYRVTASVGTNWVSPQSASSPKRTITISVLGAGSCS